MYCTNLAANAMGYILHLDVILDNPNLQFSNSGYLACVRTILCKCASQLFSLKRVTFTQGHLQTE
jgi:hypothetical protein